MENMKIGNGMDLEKNIIKMVESNMKVNFQMENGMEKEKNIFKMVK